MGPPGHGRTEGTEGEEEVTDRYAGFVVTLESDLRSDDAEATVKAIMQIKGVIAVEPLLTTGALHMATARAQREIERKILDALFPPRAD